MNLTEFLLARIAEDEEAAGQATTEYGRWEVDDGDDLDVYEVAVFPERGGSTCVARTWLTSSGKADAEHIARHDPTRVLAECEAKRRIVEEHRAEWEGVVGEPNYGSAVIDEVFRLLALPYASHPAYDETWRP